MIEVKIENELVTLVERAPEAISDFVRRVAEDERASLEAESASSAHGLAHSWAVQRRGRDQRVYTRRFWAHFVERGTRPHGPKRATVLRFVVDGEDVWAQYVQGEPARPFVDRALARTVDRLDELMASSLARAGLE